MKIENGFVSLYDDGNYVKLADGVVALERLHKMYEDEILAAEDGKADVVIKLVRIKAEMEFQKAKES